MLITHEPLYQSKKTFLINPSELKYLPNKKREELAKRGGFCVYRLHSEWDDARGGNNDTLTKILGLEVTGYLPYGRIGKIAQTTLKEFTQKVIKALNCSNALIVGDDNKPISTVAVVAGSGNALTGVMELAKN